MTPGGGLASKPTPPPSSDEVVLMPTITPFMTPFSRIWRVNARVSIPLIPGTLLSRNHVSRLF